MTLFRKLAPSLFLGFADLAHRRPILPETVADAAVRVLEQLSERRRWEFEDNLATALAEHDALWADELRNAERAAMAAQIEFHLAGLLERRFDGVDIIVLKAKPGGPSAALADGVLSRSGLTGRVPAQFDYRRYAAGLLQSGLSGAKIFLFAARRTMGIGNDLLEDDELESPWRDADDADRLPGSFIEYADAFLDERPDAAVDQLEGHLRRRLLKELPHRGRIARSADPALSHPGADDARLVQSDLSDVLNEALHRRPVGQRLDRLMLEGISEKFLMALTHRFLNPAPDEAASDRPLSLAAFLKQGVERCFELTLRMQALGNASRYAKLVVFHSMEMADLDAVEAAITHVAARAAHLEAQGSPFLQPEACRPGRRTICIGFDGSERHWGNRRRVEDVVACGEPLRIARAKSVLAKALATDMQAERAVRTAQLEEAIRLWRDAAAFWTRESAPRKWGSLMHNIALAEDALAEFQPERELRQRALESIRMAMEAFDPDKEPWCHAAAWAAMLQIQEAGNPSRSPPGTDASEAGQERSAWALRSSPVRPERRGARAKAAVLRYTVKERAPAPSPVYGLDVADSLSSHQTSRRGRWDEHGGGCAVSALRSI